MALIPDGMDSGLQLQKLQPRVRNDRKTKAPNGNAATDLRVARFARIQGTRGKYSFKKT
ncbi:hypothetical protein N9Y42_01625 [Mariniblastus sp.]|nr:hypothetical protein [Mariniblastus sp.]